MKKEEKDCTRYNLHRYLIWNVTCVLIASLLHSNNRLSIILRYITLFRSLLDISWTLVGSSAALFYLPNLLLVLATCLVNSGSILVTRLNKLFAESDHRRCCTTYLTTSANLSRLSSIKWKSKQGVPTYKHQFHSGGVKFNAIVIREREIIRYDLTPITSINTI